MAKRWFISIGTGIIIALIIFKFTGLNTGASKMSAIDLAANIDLELYKKTSNLSPVPNYDQLEPYFEFINTKLLKEIPDTNLKALSETEHPLNDDIWFWTDDNAKALECFVLPGALDAYRKTAESVYDFIISQSPGPFIFRRIAVDSINLTEKDPGNFKVNTGLMNLHGDLKNGLIFQGYRFHDDRVKDSLLYSGNMIRLEYDKKTHVFDFEDNIVSTVIINENDELRLRQIAELYINNRLIGNAIIDLVVMNGRNYTRREATFKAAPGLELNNVQVALGYDNLSSNGKHLHYHKGFTWHQPDVYNLFKCSGKPYQVINNGPIKWFALFQDENLGFSYGIVTIPENGDFVEQIVSKSFRKDKFDYVYTWYNMGNISDTSPATISEKNILLAGGLYNSFQLYAPIFDHLETFLEEIILFISLCFLFIELRHNDMHELKTGNFHPGFFLLCYLVMGFIYFPVAYLPRDPLFYYVFHFYLPIEIALSFFSFVFILRFLKTKNYKCLIILICCILYGVFRSRKFLAFYALPLLATLLFLFYIQLWLCRNRKWPFGELFCFIFLGVFAVDMVLLKYVFPNLATVVPYFEGQEIPKTELGIFNTEFIMLISGRNGMVNALTTITLLACMVILGFIFFKQVYRTLKNKDPFFLTGPQLPHFFFLILTTSITCATILANLLLSNILVYRYYTFLCVWVFFFGIIQLFIVSGITESQFKKFNRSFMVITLALIMALVYFFNDLKKIPADFASLMRYDAPVLDMQNAICLDMNKEKYNLKYGISGFWTARPITAMSKKGIRVNQISWTEELLPYYWDNTKSSYLEGLPRLGEPEYNFVVISERDPENAQALIRNKFGPESVSFTCPNCDSLTTVMVYNPETLFDLRLKNIWQYTGSSILYDKNQTRWFYWASILPMRNDTRKKISIENTSFSTIAGTTPAGVLTYGPYIPDFKPGNYEVSLNYSIDNVNISEKVLSWDILLNTNQIFASGEILKEKEDQTVFKKVFSIDKPAATFEFRTFLTNPEAVVTLYKLSIRKI